MPHQEFDLQGNEAECFGSILSTANRLPVPAVNPTTSLVEILSQEDERSEPPRAVNVSINSILPRVEDWNQFR
jgi:hypothetical protein